MGALDGQVALVAGATRGAGRGIACMLGEAGAHFGVTEANWHDAIPNNASFEFSETPFFVGRAVAALAADPKILEKSGGLYSSWNLAREYGFDDIDGSRPDFGKALDEHPEWLKPQTRFRWSIKETE